MILRTKQRVSALRHGKLHSQGFLDPHFFRGTYERDITFLNLLGLVEYNGVICEIELLVSKEHVGESCALYTVKYGNQEM